MEKFAQLQGLVEQLTAAAKALSKHHDDIESAEDALAVSESESDADAKQARASILASTAAIRMLLGGPAEFLQHLAAQVEILACLRWLAEFQILACIPAGISVPIKDLSDLTGVPEGQLSRVIRLTATCGFLQEPKPHHVTHTTLSAQFTTDQSLLDAVVFLAASAAPAALQMASAHHFGAMRTPTGSAYNLAVDTMRPFHATRREGSKLDRQWAAYLLHAGGLQQEDAVVDALSRLNWANLGSACIVEVGAQSTSLARRLAKKFPSLRLVVQLAGTHSGSLTRDGIWQAVPSLPSACCGPDGECQSEADSREPMSERISVTYRTSGMPQPVTDAAVYLLHTQVAHPKTASAQNVNGMGMGMGMGLAMTVRAELQDHLGVLRASGGVMLILTTRLLPDPGSTPDPEVEAVARTRDLHMLQLANEAEMEMTELLAIIETVGDALGKLALSNELRSHDGLVLALAVKYQAY